MRRYANPTDVFSSLGVFDQNFQTPRPHCGRANETVAHTQKTRFIRDLPSHGKSVAIHLDVPRLRCKPCNKTLTAAVPEVDLHKAPTAMSTSPLTSAACSSCGDRERKRKLAENVFHKGGKLILSTSSPMPDETPVENVRAMFGAARKYCG